MFCRQSDLPEAVMPNWSASVPGDEGVLCQNSSEFDQAGSLQTLISNSQKQAGREDKWKRPRKAALFSQNFALADFGYINNLGKMFH